MGSGGPRGLQILRSGASGVRGGFDSHAFPPLLHGLALTLALTVGPASARAQASADSIAARAGVQVVGSARAPARSAAADTTRRRPWTTQPRMVMARSLLVPGWGQAYNHAWLKAVAVATGEGLLGARIVQDQRRLDDLLGELDRVRAGPIPGMTDDERLARESQLVNEYNARLDQRLARQWILGAVLAYALVDAYVDAHFRDFEIEFRHDPALPAGTPQAPPGDGGAARGPWPGMSLGLRWTF